MVIEGSKTPVAKCQHKDPLLTAPKELETI